jgi:hypothetical protein
LFENEWWLDEDVAENDILFSMTVYSNEKVNVSTTTKTFFSAFITFVYTASYCIRLDVYNVLN